MAIVEYRYIYQKPIAVEREKRGTFPKLSVFGALGPSVLVPRILFLSSFRHQKSQNQSRTRQWLCPHRRLYSELSLLLGMARCTCECRVERPHKSTVRNAHEGEEHNPEESEIRFYYFEEFEYVQYSGCQ